MFCDEWVWEFFPEGSACLGTGARGAPCFVMNVCEIFPEGFACFVMNRCGNFF